MIRSARNRSRNVILFVSAIPIGNSPLATEQECTAIGDAAARSFAAAFYRALGNRRSVGNAVEQAIAVLVAEQIPDEHLPCCRTRNGVDAAQMYLSEPSIARPASPSNGLGGRGRCQTGMWSRGRRHCQRWPRWMPSQGRQGPC